MGEKGPQDDSTAPTLKESLPSKVTPAPESQPARTKSGLSAAFAKKSTPPPAAKPPAKPSVPPTKPTPSKPPAPPKATAKPPVPSKPPPPLPSAQIKEKEESDRVGHASTKVRAEIASLIPAAPKGPPRTGFEFRRTRAYSFALDDAGSPILLGSGRFSRLYLGYERWEESLTHQTRQVVIQMLQAELDDDDVTRFRQEKSLLEYLQGHPSIVELLGSGTIEDAHLPDVIRSDCAGDFLVLEKLDLSLMERLKGSRNPAAKEDLLALPVRDRLARALDYVIPVACAVEFAHIVRDVSHRDINPSNILLGLPDPKLAGSAMQVRLSDFSAAKLASYDGVTRIGAGVPGTMYFQSPEQETNLLGILVDVKQGSRDVDFFEDFYVHIAKNDTFALVNRGKPYAIREVDRAKKRLVLETPFAEASEEQVRANVQKRVGRPADIYAIGALLYYLLSGAARNPKALNDAFRKFDEYDGGGDERIETYLRSEYDALADARSGENKVESGVFRYRHFLDGNDEPIPEEMMIIVARCMIRDKVDSYCASNDLETKAITQLVRDLVALQPGGTGVARAMSTALALPTWQTSVATTWKRTRQSLGRLFERLVSRVRR